MVCKECVVIRVRLVRWVFKVFLVFLAALDLWVSKARLVLLEPLVQSDFVASKVRLEVLVCVVLLEQLDQLVQSVFVVRLVLKV